MVTIISCYCGSVESNDAAGGISPVFTKALRVHMTAPVFAWYAPQHQQYKLLEMLGVPRIRSVNSTLSDIGVMNSENIGYTQALSG